MTSKYVIVNCELPIEYKLDGTINVIQDMINFKVSHQINSLEDIKIDEMLPDLKTQIKALLEAEPDPDIESGSDIEPDSDTEPEPKPEQKMYVLKDECKKPHKKTTNCSLKNINKSYKPNKTKKNYPNSKDMGVDFSQLLMDPEV